MTDGPCGAAAGTGRGGSTIVLFPRVGYAAIRHREQHVIWQAMLVEAGRIRHDSSAFRVRVSVVGHPDIRSAVTPPFKTPQLPHVR